MELKELSTSNLDGAEAHIREKFSFFEVKQLHLSCYLLHSNDLLSLLVRIDAKVGHLWRHLDAHLDPADPNDIPPRVEALQLKRLDPRQVAQGHCHRPI